MDTNSEFLAALAAFESPALKPVEFRVYYDPQTGQILNYTNEDLPGKYIIVDKDTFHKHRFDCLVKDDRLVPFKLPIGKLIPSETGTACHVHDITVIARSQDPLQHWKLHTYED